MKEELEKISEQYGLGKILETPKRIFGGLLHEMWKISTSKGIFAVKILNSEILKRPEAYNNFVFREKIANIAKNGGISAISAILKGDDVILKEGDKYFIVFPWVEGYVLPENPAGDELCYKIGKVLAQIHNLGIENISNNLPYEEMKIDLNNLNLLEKDYKGISRKIIFLKNQFNNNLSLFNSESLISHRDIDQKNVIWDNDNNPMIIDWEATGPINPIIELLTMSLYWGGIVSGKIEETSFKSIIKGYSETRQINHVDIKKYIYGCIGFVDWLMYNIKRSKNTKNISPEEKELAEKEIVKNVAVIELFYSNIEIFDKWISEI